MKKLPEILAAYRALDTLLESERSQSDANGAERARVFQVLNDQAYFLLCWGQLETEIDETCRRSIRARRSSGDWTVRRGWDLYNPDDRRLSGLSFEDRTALVLDRAGARGRPYARAMLYYEIRNRVAHGKLEADRLDVIAIAQDFYAIQAALQQGA